MSKILKNQLILCPHRRDLKAREATRTKQIHAYTIDLTKIDGRGEFQCPRCGTAISPDDDTKETYSILEPKVDSNGLEELLIRCNTCESKIHLTGFSLLQKYSG